MATLNPELCSICGHNYKSSRCPHPWDQPFEHWPNPMLKVLRSLVEGPSREEGEH